MQITNSRTDGTPQVRVAMGWRAREVERRSTAQVRFNDDDYSVIVVEDGPVSLAYADSAHAFVLPSGRYLRADQAAGRVFSASASPQMDALAPEAVEVLADSIAHLLENAGWRRVAGVGLGARAAVVEATRAASGDGSGTVDVGAWQSPRAAEPWAAVPPDPVVRRTVRPGVDASLSVRPMKRRSAVEGGPRLLLTLRVEDDQLSRTLNAMVAARQARHGGETLTGWDAHPNEALSATGPR